MDKRAIDTLADAPQQEEPHPPRIKRTRIRQACQRCTKRKTKCNDIRPCAACTAAGVQCTDWRPGEGNFSAPANTSMQGLENLSYDFSQQPVSLNEFDQLVDPTLRRQMIEHINHDAWPITPSSDRHQRPSVQYDKLYRNERGLLENASTSAGFSHLAYLARLQSGDHRDESIPSWPNPMHERRIPPPAVPNLYELVESKMGWKIMIMLIRPFLETNYVLWPTFHLPTFLSSLASIRSNQDPEYICLLIAIAFMALRERRTRKDLAEDTAIEFAQLYWEIRNAELGRDWSSPTAIQGMLYLSIGYMGGAWHQGVELGRKTVGEAVVKCLDSGIHRSASDSGITKVEEEERRRTFWAVYCLDKSIAIAGRPSLLRLTDVDQGEITILDPTLQERIAPEMPSLLAYHRTAIRLHMVLERILAKINIPSCTTASAIKAISQEMGVRRYDETHPHPQTCEADHRPTSFVLELQLLDKYQYSDIPLPSRAIEEDSMYHRHLARIRTMSAFCRLLIASHLFTVANSDRQPGSSGNMKQAADILKWSDEILESQRPAVEKGSFPDYGASTVTQIAHVASSLLAVIHLLQHDNTGEDVVSLSTCTGPLHSAIHLLRSLRARFDVVIKHLDPLEHYAAQLGVSLPPADLDFSVETLTQGSVAAPQTTSSSDVDAGTKTGEELVSEALGVLANETANAEAQQPGQTSGSGAIQALLSLSGRTGEEEGGDGAVGSGSEGLEAWWASLLGGPVDGVQQDFSI